MATFNEIDEGGLNAILVRRLGMKTGTPAPTIAPEIMPMLALENDRPEWGFPKGEMACSGVFTTGIVAGQYAIVNIVNPLTSGVLAVIDHISNLTGEDFNVCRISFGTQVMTATVYAGVCDLRFRFRTMGVQTAVDNRATVANQGLFDTLVGTQHVFSGSIVLPPSSCVQLQSVNVGVAISANVRWYERPVQGGELV
jgi:hypothetical protein